MLGQSWAKTGGLHSSLSTPPAAFQGVLHIHGAGTGGVDASPRQMLGQLQSSVLTLHARRCRTGHGPDCCHAAHWHVAFMVQAMRKELLRQV